MKTNFGIKRELTKLSNKIKEMTSDEAMEAHKLECEMKLKVAQDNAKAIIKADKKEIKKLKKKIAKRQALLDMELDYQLLRGGM